MGKVCVSCSAPVDDPKYSADVEEKCEDCDTDTDKDMDDMSDMDMGMDDEDDM